MFSPADLLGVSRKQATPGQAGAAPGGLAGLLQTWQANAANRQMTAGNPGGSGAAYAAGFPTAHDLEAFGGQAVNPQTDRNGLAEFRGRQANAVRQTTDGGSSGGLRVDQDFIRNNEQSNAKQLLKAVVPGQASGVTVAHGVDLGAQNVQSLKDLGLDQSLVNKLTPYLGLKRRQANEMLAVRPLNLTQAEADALDTAVYANRMQGVVEAFDRDSSVGRFADLPAGAQTAIADVYFQYGPNTPRRVPQFWSQVTQGDWEGAHRNLMNFGDKHRTRRHGDAAHLAPDIQAGSLPRPQPGGRPPRRP